jgi:PPOX class probable F420-dependent enzyme
MSGTDRWPVPTVPAGFGDLVDCPPVAALTTLLPGGRPQTTVVWCDADGDEVRVNTMRGFRKERNMRARRQVTLLCFDPRAPLRSLEIRGRVVEMTEDGARAHLDWLARRYTGATHYFGGCVPAELAQSETPVLCRIRPERFVALDARPEAGRR